MTKEELKKEAEEYAFTHWADTDEKGDYLEDDVLIKEAYLASAEPREKRIAELEDKLANADYQLEGRDNEIKELKAQIEKMKTCTNCHHITATVINGGLSHSCGNTRNEINFFSACDKWELRK